MKKTYWLIVLAFFTIVLLMGCGSEDNKTVEAENEQWEVYYEDPTKPTVTQPYEPPYDVDPAPKEPEQQPADMIGYESRIISQATQMQNPDTIWREAVLDPEDPENLDHHYEFGNPNFSTEGKVYANDRVIAIDVESSDGKEIFTFTFGYITGEYNQFLYLQPQCSAATLSRPIGYYVTCELGYGAILCREEAIECDLPVDHVSYGLNTCNYMIPNQAYDLLVPATYSSPVTPGVAWYTPTALEEEYGIVNIRAVDLMNSSTIAMIRLYIAKDMETGTYYLHHAENRNLLQTGPTEEVSQELIDSAMEKTRSYLERNDLLTISGPDSCSYMMEYLEADKHYYYFETIVPIYAEGLDHTMRSSRLPLPVLAVTLNAGIYGKGPNTIYIGVFGSATQILAYDLLYPHDTTLCLHRIPDERPYD